MGNRHIQLSILAAMAAVAGAQAQTLQTAPRLVVSIAIDQLRADYMEAFAPLYGREGFQKLLYNGRVYTNATFSFAPVDRASAIAAIATGTTPYYNGIVARQWLDRETLLPTFCADDKRHHGLGTDDSSAPSGITTSTIADELKVFTNGRATVYSIAPFREAAILAGGHAANGALWIDNDNGLWASSEYYYKELPRWVRAFNDLHAGFIGSKEWNATSSAAGSYSYFMSGGAQKPFSHRFKGERRVAEFKASGLVNESVTDIALQCIGSEAMGRDDTTDMLCLTYYAGNFDHKPLAECQLELQDTYVRLDRELERLVKSIEREVGAGNVLFVITSTGYGDEESADYSKYRIPSGTFYINRTANLLNMYLSALWGQGKYVDAAFGTQIFLNHELIEKRGVALADALSRVKEFLVQVEGVSNVFTSQQLLAGGDSEISKVRAGFNAERSGDIILEVRPGWKMLNEDTGESHLSRAAYTQFPIIFYGSGARAEKVSTPVTTDQIAPTLARAIRIRAPNACEREPLF